VAKSLEQQLTDAKAEVARLEEQLAMARQGVTTDVLKERNDLNNALHDQQKRVVKEVNEAESVARVHNEDTERARKELERTQPAQRVEARVKTETTVVPNNEAARVETTTQQATIPVETSRVVETQQAEQATPADERARARAAENPVQAGDQRARPARTAATQPATQPAQAPGQGGGNP